MRWLGKRIRELREAKGLPRSSIWSTRHYATRLEGDKLTPRLLALEQIADHLNTGLWRFFVSDETHINLLILEDPFVYAISLLLPKLSEQDKAHILKVLAAAPVKPNQ